MGARCPIRDVQDVVRDVRVESVDKRGSSHSRNRGLFAAHHPTSSLEFLRTLGESFLNYIVRYSNLISTLGSFGAHVLGADGFVIPPLFGA